MVYAAQDNYFIFWVLKKWYVWFYSVFCLEKQKPSKWYARKSSTCVFITKEEVYHTEKHNSIQERMLFSLGFPFRLVLHELNDLFKKIRVESKKKVENLLVRNYNWVYNMELENQSGSCCVSSLFDWLPTQFCQFLHIHTYIHTSSGWCLGVVDCNEFCYLTEAPL